jgi:hypothetical protein
MNKKYIIILGTAFLSFVLLSGLVTYYSEQEKSQISFWLDSEPEDSCSNFLYNENRPFVLCCVEGNKFYNCSNRDEFKLDEVIEVVVDPAKLTNIPEGFDYVCLLTDMWRKESVNIDRFRFIPEECFSYKKDYLWKITGLISSDTEGVFTLLKANLYLNSEKDVEVEIVDDEDVVKIKDEFTIINIMGQIQ